MSLTVSLGKLTRPVTDRIVYTDRASVARGMKRRGGLGFIPRTQTAEERYIARMDVRDKVVYDIGAFQGLFTLRFARDARHVVVFEPHPWCRATTAENVHVNRLGDRVTIVPVALSDKTSLLTMAYPHDEPARATIDSKIAESLERNGYRMRRESVLCWPLDRAVHELGLPLPEVIKIDAEGAEAAILRGAEETIRTSLPALYIELHGTGQAVSSVLMDFRYVADQIDETHIWATPAARTN